MADQQIDYERLMQDALRGVVRTALERAAGPDGMPEPHHYYITFKTQAPGVTLPADLLDKYPDEMTIVLKTRYWDLEVEDEDFSVRLTFNEVPARLTVPYRAVSRFYDPSVPFGLRFDVEVPPAVRPLPTAEVEAEPGLPQVVPSEASAASDAADEDAAPAEETPSEGGEVVSLDAFRKKS